MSAEDATQDHNDRESVPELAPLQKALSNTAPPAHLKTLVLGRFVDAGSSIRATHPGTEQSNSNKKFAPLLGAIAACGAAAIALGAFFLPPSTPNLSEPLLQAQQITRQAEAASAIRDEQTAAPIHERRTIQLSPTGPIYTRIALPIQTHSLESGPRLRYVNALTYEDRKGLSRAVFIRNSGAR